MAKGTPTADENANFGVGAAPAKINPNPNIMAGASMTKAPKGLAEGSGYWAPNNKLPPGVTAQWVPPAATPTTVSPTTSANRNLLAEVVANNSTPTQARLYGTGGSSSDRGGYSTSGSGWGGNSSAGSGYGMGGRDRG